MGIEIRRFHAGDGAAFRELNEAWIAKFFVIEDEDRVALGDPQGYILDRGGHIFIAVLDGRPVGTCALIATGPGTFEVAKMAVAEELRGMGIGRQVLEYAVREARGLRAKVLTLETNSSLGNAVHLYETTGFRHVPVHASPYTRANVFMEMTL